ncbi:hypothetical protein TSMEX_007924, partial [Taenia solium]
NKHLRSRVCGYLVSRENLADPWIVLNFLPPRMESKSISKNLTEENNELKQYIDSLNKECMELQAALFEEANKMILKKEVKALKNALRLHVEEKPDVLAVRKSMSSVVPSASTLEADDKGKSNRLRRLSFLLNPTSNPPHSSTSLASQVDRRRWSSTLSTSIINVTSQEPVTRRYLLEALTSSVTCAEAVGDDHFQASPYQSKLC